MKSGQILVKKKIAALCWKLKTSSRSFFDFIEMTI